MKRPAAVLEPEDALQKCSKSSEARLDFLTMLLFYWTRPQLLALLEVFLEVMHSIKYESTQLEQVTQAAGHALVRGSPSLQAAAEFMLRESYGFKEDAALRSMLLCLLALDMRVQRFAYSNHRHHDVLGSRPPDRRDLTTFRITLQHYVCEFLQANPPQPPIELVKRCRELLETYRYPRTSTSDGRTLPVM